MADGDTEIVTTTETEKQLLKNLTIRALSAIIVQDRDKNHTARVIVDISQIADQVDIDDVISTITTGNDASVKTHPC